MSPSLEVWQPPCLLKLHTNIFFSCILLLLAVRALRALLLQRPTQMNVPAPPLPHASLHLECLRMFSPHNNTNALKCLLKLMPAQHEEPQVELNSAS